MSKVEELKTIFKYFCLSTVGINPNATPESIAKVMEERNYAIGRDETGSVLFFGKEDSNDKEPIIFASIDLGAIDLDQVQYSKPVQYASQFDNHNEQFEFTAELEESFIKDNCMLIGYGSADEDSPKTLIVHIPINGQMENHIVGTVTTYEGDTYVGAIIDGKYVAQPYDASHIPVSYLMESLGVRHTNYGDFFIDCNDALQYDGPLDYAYFVADNGEGIVLQLPKPM